jgi:thiamine kinase-like enzyme
MEDLDASGFPIRLHHDKVSLTNAKNCLSWLAHFHANFMNTRPEGLWLEGTYWHLETRPDEWEKMENTSLKNAASAVDQKLHNAKYQTIIHGDAKLANFCFAEKGSVAAVDFQYVGKGCGMKDVAYFISSCFEAKDCEKYEEELLQHYFNELEDSLGNTIDYQAVEKEWILLYKYAWADLYRFLDGWSPGHWKMHEYSKQLTNKVLNELKFT